MATTVNNNNIESKNRVNNKAEHKVTPEVIDAHMKALREQDSQKRKAPAYAVGTRVLCKAYGVMGTVKENNYLYKVEYDSPVDCNGHTYTYGIYGEYGITTNYDEQGREIVGNANYYAYELTAGYWGDDTAPRHYELAGLYITATRHGLVWQVTANNGDGMIKRYAIMQLEELAAYLADLYTKEHTPTEPDEPTLETTSEITEVEGIKVGDKVKHVWSDEVATVTAIRKGYWDASDGEVWLFTLDFGKDTKGEWKTVLGPFKMELNGKEFRREALTLYEPSEIKAA